ncbi:MAG: hypothetical protein A6D91_06085 [Bacillaceae bacterium G1]|nr:adenine deaminase [Bacillota bacterium]OJF16491.1 MAG: hypothetical protein A6D91_06085 [Bacillaceae bacterium G1]
MSADEMRRLMAVAKREEPGDVVIQHATIINVYTQELMEAHVAISGKRIAYVGNDLPPLGDETDVIDGRGYVLSPGYFEPHAHSTLFFNPATFAEKALYHGTTAIVHDNLALFLSLEPDRFLEALDRFASYPVKMFWSARLDGQTADASIVGKFSTEAIRQLLAHPFVLQVGELTDWPRLFGGDEQMVQNVLSSLHVGKRVEGHFPGASWKTLNTAAAAGVGACHESMTGEDVLMRLRLGMYATLRLSPIRPDLPDIIRQLTAENMFWSNRLMLTTDGPTPALMEKGLTDYLLQTAMEAGLEPLVAYRLATLNPATYYGLDGELGGIAPGRLADILFLRDERQPRPVQVMAEGKMVYQAEQLQVTMPLPEVIRLAAEEAVGDKAPMSDEWLVPELFTLPVPPSETADGADTEAVFPVIQLRDAVITVGQLETFVVREGQLDWTGQEGLLMASLLDRNGHWITNGLLRGFARRLDALAVSFGVSGDLLVLGREPSAMAEAARRLIHLGGGAVLLDGQGDALEIQLPIFQSMSDKPYAAIAEQAIRLDRRLRAAGYPHLEPIYTLMFLPATHLPYIRLTSQGIYSVKDRRVLHPARELQPDKVKR